MLDMARHYVRRNRYTIAMGLPIAVLLASSLSVVRAPESLSLTSEGPRYVAAGEEVLLDVMVASDEPINTVAGTLVLGQPSLRVTSVRTDHSIIDLWQTPPTEDGDTVRFAGGITETGGFVGNALVVRVGVRADAPGRYTVKLADAMLLAHDGLGTPLPVRAVPYSLVVRPSEQPTPDVNGDRVVNLFDFGLVSARMFRTYEARYDLNHDGRITLADIAVIINTMTDDSRLGSFAVLF